jgi:hypothetical protein
MKITLPNSLYEIDVRRQPAQLLDILRNRIAEELKEHKPAMPMQRVEISPGEFREVEAPNEEYQAKLSEFDELVGAKYLNRLWEVIAEIGVITKPDLDEITELRKSYERLNVDVPSNDKLFWLQYIVAPGIDDFNTLLYEVFGKSLPNDKQVAFHRQLFRGQVSQ